MLSAPSFSIIHPQDRRRGVSALEGTLDVTLTVLGTEQRPWDRRLPYESAHTHLKLQAPPFHLGLLTLSRFPIAASKLTKDMAFISIPLHQACLALLLHTQIIKLFSSPLGVFVLCTRSVLPARLWLYTFLVTCSKQAWWCLVCIPNSWDPSQFLWSPQLGWLESGEGRGLHERWGGCRVEAPLAGPAWNPHPTLDGPGEAGISVKSCLILSPPCPSARPLTVKLTFLFFAFFQKCLVKERWGFNWPSCLPQSEAGSVNKF